MLQTVAVIAAAAAAFVAFGRLSYRSILYPAPTRGLTRAPLGGELKSFKTPDGAEVQTVIYSPRDAAACALMFFHGNGESVADSAGMGQLFAARGLAFVAVEYRGYGTSPARGPSEEGLYADAEGALAGLRELGFSRDRITLWGRSLGTGVAVEMERRGHAARLLLEAPYTSIPAVAASFVPLLPTGLIIGDKFDNLAKAPHITAPTLIIHGDADGVVPYRMGKQLSETIAGAQLITVAGGGHNDLWQRARARLLAAVERHARACKP